VFFIYLYVHLQHSQLWISFTGWLGHLFMSPAHHQIHHSRNPAHFNKNLGSCLALWDWMFGTLYMSRRAERERLEFGVEPDREHAHTIRGELIAPFVRAAQMLKELFERPSVARRRLAERAEAGLLGDPRRFRFPVALAAAAAYLRRPSIILEFSPRGFPPLFSSAPRIGRGGRARRVRRARQDHYRVAL
jgi:hypothetical protein